MYYTRVIELFSYNGVVVPGLPNLEKTCGRIKMRKSVHRRKNCAFADEMIRVSDNDNDQEQACKGIPTCMGWMVKLTKAPTAVRN